VVALLVADGLIERSADPGDRRSWLLSLSHTGRARVRRDRDVRVARIAGLVETTLSAVEQKRLRASIGLLDRISAAAKD
jgi:MarR family transcriptional regulator for hemolysin